MLTKYNDFLEIGVCDKRFQDRVEELDGDHAALICHENTDILETPLFIIPMFICLFLHETKQHLGQKKIQETLSWV